MNRRYAALFALLLGSEGSVQAQASATPGTISGLVIDAATSQPLAGATVGIEPRTGGALPSRVPGASAFIQATRSTVTDSAGRYQFGGIPEGDYRLHVQRLGYRSTTVGVEVRGAGRSQVSIGLNVQPVALAPLEVSAAPLPSPANTYGRKVTPEARDNARLAAERSRQREYLSSDVRAVTHADVVEGVTLAETDLFRALQKLPGVSAPDEYSAELWTRGAPWDHTRVYFDGLPLFSPLHALGLFSGVNPDAVGGAFLHPGVQPAWASGGAASTLDLRTRSGSASDPVSGIGEFSLASSRLAVDGASSDARHSWMVAGRRTYLDWLTGIAENILGRDKTYQLPYSFYDLTGRYDFRIGERSGLEVSGLLQRDAVGNDNPNVLNGVRAQWGGGGTRATLQFPLGNLRVRQSVGFSGFRSSATRWQADWSTGSEDSQQAIVDQKQSNALGYAVWEGSVSPFASGKWSAGYQIFHQTVRFAGPRPTLFNPLDPAAYQIQQDDHLVQGALWGEWRWTPLDALAVETATRLEFTPSGARWAPRVTARYQLDPSTSLSAGWGRTYQDLQAIAPAGPSATEGFRTDHLWVLAGGSTPALRSDIATAGVERWIGDWIASLNLYLRHSNGLAMPDPVPGPALERPLYVVGENRSRGVDVAARRLAGPWTASVAYSLGRSERTASGLDFSAPEDQRHVLDATALVRLDPRWRLGASYTAATGTPYTQFFSGQTHCRLDGSCTWGEEPWIGTPGARRTGSYQSLDLLVDWTRQYRKWDLAAYLQLRNALYNANPGRYLGAEEALKCVAGQCTRTLEDEFLPGMPILPLVGIRIAF